MRLVSKLQLLDADRKVFPKLILGCLCPTRNYGRQHSIPTSARQTDTSPVGKRNSSTQRAVLINSVLDSQLIYLMCAIKLPAGVREQIDRRRRAFLWAMDG